MPFKYIKIIKLDNKNKYIGNITFSISRYAKYKLTIRFDELVTEKEAIKYVEKWLSVKVTDDYYQMVKDDLFHDSLESYGKNPCRGDLLGDLKYLEILKDVDSTVEIFCGS